MVSSVSPCYRFSRWSQDIAALIKEANRIIELDVGNLNFSTNQPHLSLWWSVVGRSCQSLFLLELFEWKGGRMDGLGAGCCCCSFYRVASFRLVTSHEYLGCSLLRPRVTAAARSIIVVLFFG